MRSNHLRNLWSADQAVINGWLTIPDSFAAEVMANQGWDSLTIDLQHGLIEPAAMLVMLQAILCFHMRQNFTHEFYSTICFRLLIKN